MHYKVRGNTAKTPTFEKGGGGACRPSFYGGAAPA